MPEIGEDERPEDERATSATMRAAPVTGSFLEDDRSETRAADEALADEGGRRVLAERLVAVETLAAGLAHEINNPLTYTLINVESVLRKMRVLAAAPRRRAWPRRCSSRCRPSSSRSTRRSTGCGGFERSSVA